ncbi:MAG: DUF5360 family protein [Actinomycetota bacterium]
MLTRAEKVIVWAIDLGFLAYWTVILLDVIPPEAMFAGYELPEVRAWNWSFLPLDLMASLTGILGQTVKRLDSKVMITISLVLTSCAGGMAIAYWAVLGDFQIAWWLPNAFLLLFPLVPLVRFAWRGSGSV